MKTRHLGMRRRLSGSSAALSLALLFFLAALTLPSAHAGIENRQQADELLPVDCLLPGQVRKMGGQLTYLTARRPVKTTGVNCEIRGGEYVQYDRADFTTALAIWMPMAEQGDARAQNYVGEIYEKGLGTTPDFSLAAQWYNRAAEQDYAPAQVNLGQLYELGRGVEPRKDLAIDLYRQASGIKGKQLRFVSWDYSDEKYAAMSERLAGQDATLTEQRAKIESLTLKLDTSIAREEKLAREITSSRNEYRSELVALEAAREAVAAQQARIAALQTQGSQHADAGALQESQSELQEKEQALARQRQLLARDAAELIEQRAALEAREQAMAQQGGRSLEEAQALKSEQQFLLERSQKLDERLLAADARESDLEALRVSLEAREVKLAAQVSSSSSTAQGLQTQRKELQRLTSEMESREKELASREAELHKKNTALSSLNAELAALREQLAENASAFSGRVDDETSEKEKARKPVIEMIEPQLLATRAGEYFVRTRAGLDQRTIIGRVLSQNPLRELLVNERNVRIDERGIFQERIPIRSKTTKVSVVAVDKAGLRSDLNFMLGVEDAAEQDFYKANEGQSVPKEPQRKVPRLKFGNYHALLIGNREYQSLPDLTTTVADVTALRDVLRDQYGFKTTMLTDASRYDMLSAMEKLRQELTEDDNLLIYYAGHGELDEVNTRGHWLPVDAEEDSRANWISNVAISDILNSMNANKVLVVADSCYSGSMTRSTLARLDGARSSKAWVSWLKKQANSHSRLLFSSGGVAPVLDGGGGKHSIFAKALLDVLQNNEGVMEGRQVHAQVAQAVNYAALAAQFDQTPMYAPIKFAGHEGGDFLFVAQAD